LRFDLALIRQHPGLSRRRAQDVIEKGQVLLDGALCREPGRQLGERARLDWDPNRRALPPPATSLFPILFEDEHILIIDKPAGLLSVPAHPGAGEEDSVLGRLLKERKQRAPGRRAWIGRVHRLDRDSSGALVFALTPAARDGLLALFHDHRIDRRYLALVEGNPKVDQGRIDAPIADDYDGRRRVARPNEPQRPALTHFVVRERFPGAAMLEVTLETGRQHQIRLHLAYLGLSVLGDKVYRSARTPQAPIRAPRQMLHAERLGFVHPITGKPVRAQSPLPDDFRDVLAALRRRRPATRATPKKKP
jgi:23S rRNA pseudouridine1911/1915/1917 synthase